MSDILSRLQAYGDSAAAGAPYPVDQWNPPFCGAIDMRITADGAWHYNGTPIKRPAMVRLFSRLLRRDGEACYLVTPVEKVGITVEDVPFLAVEMTVADGLTFRTNVGDTVVADAAPPLRFDLSDGFRPYVTVRGGLEARLTRSLALDLAALGDIRDGLFGVTSGTHFFPIATADNHTDFIR